MTSLPGIKLFQAHFRICLRSDEKFEDGGNGESSAASFDLNGDFGPQTDLLRGRGQDLGEGGDQGKLR